MTQHTPAPWIAKGRIYNEIYARTNNLDDWKIARLTAAKIGHAEARANAALICAAPDLLEALEYQQRHSNGDASCDYQTFLHLRDAAIAKAKQLTNNNQ